MENDAPPEPAPMSPEWLAKRAQFMRSYGDHAAMVCEMRALALRYRALRIGGDRFASDAQAAWQASGADWEDGLQVFYKLMEPKK